MSAFVVLDLVFLY